MHIKLNDREVFTMVMDEPCNGVSGIAQCAIAGCKASIPLLEMHGTPTDQIRHFILGHDCDPKRFPQPKKSKADRLPSEIVADVILRYSATMPLSGHAAILRGSLHICATNHRKERIGLSFPIHLDGEPFDGDETAAPRFVLFKIADSVWKVSPSIAHDKLHAYLTIVDVPSPAPWEAPAS